MNRQILKLAAPYFPRDTDGWIAASDPDIVKFAELIVADTLKVAGQNMGYSEFEYMKSRVGKHFGVEL
jgi:hypothetical protein